MISFGMNYKKNTVGIKEQLQELEDKISKGLDKAYEKLLKFK